MATSSTDKTLCIYDYYSGECMATMTGHSELVTGLRFSLDCQRLISASGDGCIFVWTIPRDMVTTMHARISQQTARLARHRISLSNGLNFHTNEEDSDKADSAISSDPLASYRYLLISDSCRNVRCDLDAFQKMLSIFVKNPRKRYVYNGAINKV